MLGTAGDDAAPLLGRVEEQRFLAELLGEVERRGRALVIRGEPGVGKSRLLADTARFARERGMVVLTATGVQSETDLPFAGLHQLLRPVRGLAGALTERQRGALNAAFGLTPDVAPEYFQIAMAALDLLSEAAVRSPLLVIAEDSQWLDRPSSEVLAFVGRRIESDPIILLAAVREGYPSALGEAGLPEHRLPALDEVSAASLLDEVAPALSAVERHRVLREAEGNPLALIELPRTVGWSGGGEWPTGPSVLTERLERAFVSRVSELPGETRLVLLVAALDDGESIGEIVEAAGIVAGRRLEIDVIAPAVEARIVDVDLRVLWFRHPLIRSAIAQSAGLGERRRAHEALAQTLADQPDRRAWHRAASLAGEHEDVAVELEQAGIRAQRRGAVAVAVSALRRAAELGRPAARGDRLLRAARLAVELGRRDVLSPLLGEIEQLDLGVSEQARVTWIQETSFTRPLGDTGRSWALIDAAQRAGAAGERDLQIDLLWLVASRAWWVDPGPEVRAGLIAAADGLGNADAPDPRVLAVHAYADPVGHAAGVLARLRREVAAERLDTDAARFFGPAALVVGAFDLGIDFLAAAVDGLRNEGRLGHLPRLLSLYSTMAARRGDWDVAMTAGEEARRLAGEFAEPHWAAAADTVIALVAAMRGDEAGAERLSARAEAWAEPAHANITVAFAQFAKVLAALATDRHAEAYRWAERLFDPGDSAYHPVISSWLIADLAEAAVHLDRVEAARARVVQVEAMAGAQPGAWIALALGHARALVAEPDQMGARFEEALAQDLSHWPFQRARIQLAYGRWLRRQRQVSRSREVLRAARDTFDVLGCGRWSEHTRRELRASGERSRRRVPEARDRLTAQELQIAQLAADGLSNREIGQRLYLSHRTISTHLYRAFPKLGVTSRGELNAVLAPPAGNAGNGEEATDAEDTTTPMT
jgi:DNA-binding CsgD family transcriptional regulator